MNQWKRATKLYSGLQIVQVFFKPKDFLYYVAHMITINDLQMKKFNCV